MLGKINKRWKKLLVVAMIIAIFVLIISLSVLYTERVVSCGMAQTCTIPLPFLIPIIASVSLFVGSLMGYLMVEKLSKKEEGFKISAELIEKLLNPDEYKVLKLLSKNKEISQAKIVKETGLPRLKIFRIIEKLRQRGVLSKEQKNGKLRIIKLSEDLRELFKS
jgi:uncharacterized membrane protein